jgi:hypothetical protein
MKRKKPHQPILVGPYGTPKYNLDQGLVSDPDGQEGMNGIGCLRYSILDQYIRSILSEREPVFALYTLEFRQHGDLNGAVHKGEAYVSITVIPLLKLLLSISNQLEMSKGGPVVDPSFQRSVFRVCLAPLRTRWELSMCVCDEDLTDEMRRVVD